MYSKVFLPLHGMQLCLPFCVDKWKIIKFQNWWSKKLYGGKKVLRKMSKYWDWYRNLTQHYSWSCKLRKQTLVDTDGLQTQQNEMQEKLTWDFFFSSENPAVPTWNLSGSHGDLFFLSTRHSHTRTQSHTHRRPLSPSTLNIRQQWAVGQTDVMSQLNCCDNSWWLVFVYVWLF